MNTRLKVLFGLVLGGIFATPTPAIAGERTAVCPICRRVNDQRASYPQKMGMTFLRGAANTAFGWTELLLQPTAEVKAGGHLAVGIGKGAGLAVARTALGIGELFTFWTPKGKQGYLRLAGDCPVCMGQALGRIQQPPRYKKPHEVSNTSQ